MGFFRASPGGAAVFALTLACIVSPAAIAGPQGPPVLRLKAGSFDPRVQAPQLPPHLRWEHEPDAGYFVVQLERPITPALLERLRAEGAETIHYLPEQSYVVRLATGQAQRLRALSEVRWVGPIEPGWKLAPELRSRPARELHASVDLFPGEDLRALAAEAESIGVAVLEQLAFGETRRLDVRATPGQLQRLSRLPGVSWIEEVGEITLRNDTARWVVQTNVSGSTTVWDMGLHGEGQIIGHIDDPLDMSSCYFMDPVDNTPGPAHRKVVAYHSNGGTGAALHGTHTAGIAAGDLTGSSNGDGHAYAAKLSHTVLGTFVSGYLPHQDAHNDGARVHTNSWGVDGTTAYTAMTRDIDSFAYDFEDSLVVFSVTNQATLATPENAKNILAVSASQNGSNAHLYCGGGAGPTADGRRKPEIAAPGCGIFSARVSEPCDTLSFSGTSMAAPAIAGSAALVRQYFEEGWYPTGTKQPADAIDPSGALVKAALINSAVDMTGVAGFPGNQEGWGRVLVENVLAFAGDARALIVLDDVRNANGLATGQAAGYSFSVTGNQEDLKLTLAFTEPPATTLAASATVNDLDLEVTSPSGTLYRGNWFSGGVSTAGGSADPINNLEQVLIPSPELGDWSVAVQGTAVNEGAQGYALLAAGAIATGARADLALSGHRIMDDPPLGNGDGVPDPGETITLPLTLVNTGASEADSVATRIRALGDAARVTASDASFPNIGPNDSEESLPPHHRLTISPAAGCGATLPLDVAISGSSETSESSLSLQVGLPDLTLAATDVPAAGSGSTWSVNSVIDVTTPFTPTEVLVPLTIAHPDISHLQVTLTSPTNTTVTLYDHSSSGLGLAGTYGSDMTPDGPGSMSDFAGQPALGPWTLTVTDTIGQGGPSPGTLQTWSLTLHGSSCNPLDCAGDPIPQPIRPTLSLAGDGGPHIQLNWEPVPGATAYRIWRSPTADFARQELIGTRYGTTFLALGARHKGPSEFYRLRPVNTCEWEGPVDCGGDPIPGGVAPPFIVTREQVTDLRFDWPVAEGADAYRIYRSHTPGFAQQELLGTSTTNTYLEIGTGNVPVTTFYRVRAINACEWEGP